MTKSTNKRISVIAVIMFALALLTVTAPKAIAQTNTFPSSGNAGVGTTSPSYPLTVESAPSADPFIQGYFKSTHGTYPYGGIGVDGASQSHIRFMLGGALKWQWRVGAGSGVDDLRAYNWSLGADVMTLKNTGNIGIGTADPSGAHLVISKSINGEEGAFISNTNSGTSAYSVLRTLNGSTAADAAYLATFGTGWTSTGAFKQDAGVVGSSANLSNGLSIVTEHASGEIRFYTGGWADANQRMKLTSGGNVGIGTTSPGYSLDVQSNAQWAARFKKTDATHGGILVDSATGYNPNIGLSVNGTIKWYINNNVANGDTLQFWESTGANPRFTLTQAGNVGIGTNSPTEKLHVSGNGKITGNLTIDGNIAAKYQDVAEWVPSSEQLSAGTVVVLDSTKSNQVISSSLAYDTRVAGVISAQPGITLGESGDGKVLVATTGRVRVKVDASRAPIRIGDLLVTSDLVGVAMKSEAVNLGGVQLHRPGTIIGKALEPLEKGSGTILVLLSLQ